MSTSTIQYIYIYVHDSICICPWNAHSEHHVLFCLPKISWCLLFLEVSRSHQFVKKPLAGQRFLYPMIQSPVFNTRIRPKCVKSHGLWEVWLMSWGKGLIFRNDNGVYSIAWVIGDLLRIVVGRTEKVVYSHELYNL